VEKAKSTWRSGVDRVGIELKEEAARLKDVLEGIDSIPLEDLMAEAEKGLGRIEPSLLEETPSVEQSQVVVATPVDAQLIEPAPVAPEPEEATPPRVGDATEIVVIEAAPPHVDTTEDRADTLAWISAVNAQDRRIV
jgi:hypothetical protein